MQLNHFIDDLCDPIPCLNGGVCLTSNGACDCTGTGFTGSTCDTPSMFHI